MMLQITEQVFVPMSSVVRISFFGNKATIMYVDGIVEDVKNEDALRLKEQMNPYFTGD